MRKYSALALTIVTLAIAAAGQYTRDDFPPEQVSDKGIELINWITFYYKNPTPEQFPRWLSQASAEGIFKEESNQFPFLGFLAAVFSDNADRIPKWIVTIDSLPEDQRKTVLIALWLSSTKTARQALAKRKRRKLLTGENYFRFQMKKPPPSLDEIDEYWGYLDIQWGRFFASGAETPIRNIVSVFKYAKYTGASEKFPKPPRREIETEAVMKETVYKVAAWSLRSNCQMHPRVFEICEKIYEEDNLNRYAQFALKAVLIDVKPDKYKIGETSSK